MRSIVITLAAVAAFLSFTGCGGGGGGTTGTTGLTTGTTGFTTGGTTGSTTGGGGGSSRVRFFHASPDAPPLDFFIDGQMAANGLAYQAFTTPLGIAEGERNIQARLSGTGTVVIDTSEVIAANSAITYMAVDFFDFIDIPVIFTNETAAPIGNARLRVAHLLPTEANTTFDIYVTVPGADLSTQSPLWTDIGFLVEPEYRTIAPGNWQIRATVSGTEDVLVDSGTISIPANGVRTAVMLEKPGTGEPYGTLLLPDAN